MRHRQPSRPLFWLLLTVFIVVLADLFLYAPRPDAVKAFPSSAGSEAEWQAPDESKIAAEPDGRLIRYGKALVESTACYLGPKGSVAQLSNGMNCQNCHLNGGRRNFANPFSATAATYPKYRHRSGRVEDVFFRINDCMKRSLNGKELDSASTEIKAMAAYINWVGKEVPKGVTPKGAGTENLQYLQRAADPQKGRKVYLSVCHVCHGPNGKGMLLPDATGYRYPPLWGDASYNVGAGLYRLASLAGFIKNNMPFGASWKKPLLTQEQAWDVAAFIVSQPRPVKFFSGDWKDASKKPVDYPFGPYADTFSETRHKYGPFAGMKRK